MSKKVKIWEASDVNGYSTVYYLTKEYNPIWFAKVFKNNDGFYVFTIGKRITEEDKDPPRYSWIKRGFKAPTTAQRKALENIKIKMQE